MTRLERKLKFQQIRAIRAGNNDNWMDVLQLADKYAPREEFNAILRRIAEADGEVRRLTKEIANG